MKKFKVVLFKSFLLICTFYVVLYAQPYYYYSKVIDEKGNSDIYRINLASGQNQLFLSDVGRVNDIRWNQDQTWLYVSTKYDFRVIETASKLQHTLVLDERYDGLDGAIYVPQSNKLYVTWLKNDPKTGGGSSKGFIYDATNFSLIDSNGVGISFTSILSEDGDKYYDYGPDSTGGSQTVFCISLSSKFLISDIPFSQIGPNTDYKIISDGRRGRALFQYSIKPVLEDLRYRTVDLESNKTEVDFPFPWRSEAKLSPDGKRIIVEEVYFEKSPTEPNEYRPGSVFIFDAHTGKLMQKLSLPPEGKILLFDNYPDKLFYLTGTDGNFQSIQVSLNVVTPVATLIDTLIALTNQSYQQNLIGDKNFARDLTKTLDEAKKHLTKKHADTKDSVNCAKEVRKFQKKVNKVYEETIEKEKKHEHHKEKFVTIEGWKFLYYNAQYILDRLPALKKEDEEEEGK